MTDERSTPTDNVETDEVPREEWPSWCTKVTSECGGRDVELHQADQALGHVRLAEDQTLVALEYDRFGNTEALTIKCGSSAIPVSYVVAEPRSIEQKRDKTGAISKVSVVDATGRRTSMNLG